MHLKVTFESMRRTEMERVLVKLGIKAGPIAPDLLLIEIVGIGVELVGLVESLHFIKHFEIAILPPSLNLLGQSLLQYLNSQLRSVHK